MDFFDFLRELRKGEPDIREAEKALKILGWICVFGAVWNFAFYYIAPFKASPFNIPSQYPSLALIGLSLIGSLFFVSARGVRGMEPWGRKTSQWAVGLLVVMLAGFTLFVFPLKATPFAGHGVPVEFTIVLVAFVAPLAILAYFGIRYLARLPVREGSSITADAYGTPSVPEITPENTAPDYAVAQPKYQDSPLPFGVLATFALSTAVPILAIFILIKYAGPGSAPFAFLPAFLLIFLGPVVYNYAASPFQTERNLVASFTGGGTIYLLNGSWPFFRLMVYDDGVEVRCEFHRFFIPYLKMGPIPDKIGFFSRGLLIKSDLPDVPSSIRFHGFRMKRIIKMVGEMRAKQVTDKGK